jgi:hypothetical protein
MILTLLGLGLALGNWASVATLAVVTHHGFVIRIRFKERADRQHRRAPPALRRHALAPIPANLVTDEFSPAAKTSCSRAPSAREWRTSARQQLSPGAAAPAVLWTGPDPARALAEVRRVLTPDGSLLVLAASQPPSLETDPNM